MWIHKSKNPINKLDEDTNFYWGHYITMDKKGKWNIPDKIKLNYRWRASSYNCFIIDDNKNIKNIINKNSKNLLSGNKLLFDKHVKYPRFLIKQSNLKFCKDINNADFFIVPDNFENFFASDYEIFFNAKVKGSNQSDLFEIQEFTFKNLTGKNIKDFTENDIKKFIEVLDPNLEDVYVIYIGKIIASENETFLSIINDELNISIITETQLDKFVNSYLPILNENDVKNIIDMLSSDDQNIVGLGIKVLSGYNVNATPYTIFTILVYTISHQWYFNKEINNRSFNRIINALNLESLIYDAKFGRRHTFFDQINFVIKEYKLSDYDKNLRSIIWFPYIQDSINNCNKIKLDKFSKEEKYNLQKIIYVTNLIKDNKDKYIEEVFIHLFINKL